MRGCERRVIMLKGTDSEIFDEAYFLLRRNLKYGYGNDEIVSEAQRIVSLNTTKRRHRNLSNRNSNRSAFGNIFYDIFLAIAKHV